MSFSNAFLPVVNRDCWKESPRAMEAVASVLTLLQATAILVKASRDLSRKLRNAPLELLALTTQLLAMQYELERIKYVSNQAHSELLFIAVRSML